VADGLATTTTSADDIYFAAWVGTDILDELRPYIVTPALFEQQGRKPSKVFQKPTLTDPGPASAWSELADTDTFGQTPVKISTGNAQATASMKGQAAVVDDFIDAIAVIDAVSYFAQVLGRSVAEKENTDATAQLDNAAANITASTVLLLDDFMQAIGAIEANDGLGQLVAVLNPKQVSDLRRDLTGTVAASFFGSESGASTVKDALPDAKMNGHVGNIAGVDVYQTSAVALSTTYRGSMFVKGVAFLEYKIWDARTESHREALHPSTVLTCSANYGFATVRNTWAEGVRSA
jgi:hypothetical protein